MNDKAYLKTRAKTHLRTLVREDAVESGPGAHDEALFRTVEQLQHWEAPEVTSEMTAKLVDLLAAELPAPAARQPGYARRIRESWAVLLIRSQFRVVSRELWVASALVMLLGTLVTLATYHPDATVLPLVILAPVVTAMGIAFVYGPLNDPALEIELAAPVSPRLLVLARITLVFGFNFVLGMVASALLAFSGVGFTFVPLVAAWLAPMAFLSALAFLMSVLFFDPLVSTLFSGLLWTVLSLRHYGQLDLNPLLQLVPNLLAVEARPLIWLLAVLLMGAALWLVGQDERWIGAQGEG